MEGVAAAASIIAIIHTSGKILARIKEYGGVANEIPQYLRHTENKLILLRTVSKQVEIRRESGSIEPDYMRAIEPMLQEYGQQIEELEIILQKLIPTSQSDAWTRTKIVVKSISEEKKVEKITKTLNDCVQYLNFFLTSITTNFQPQTDDKLLKILDWLDAPDPSINYDKALDSKLECTGLWFLDGEAFANWKTDKASRIWLYGIPGCGKSVLSSAIIENLSHIYDNIPGKVVVYYYFDFSDKQKQDVSSMLRSLICQLAQNFHKIPEDLEKAFSEYGKMRKSLPQKGLLQLLRQTIKEFPQVYVVLDALDECATWGELMKVLEDIFNWQLPHMHIIITSRREKQIEDVLEDIKGPREHICIMNDAVDEDIKLYVNHELSSRKSLRKKSNEIKAEIERALAEGAKGMFRWAVCQIDELEKSVNEKMIRKALSSLPRTLDETYERILSAISVDYSEYVIRILQWLAFSARPLSLKEVTEIAALDPFRDPEPAFAEEEILDDEGSILSICSSLITFIKDTDDSVILAHYSVKEYLLSERSRMTQYSLYDLDCNAFIATCCLKYYLQLLQPKHDDKDNQIHDALKNYAKKFWCTHCRLAGEKSTYWMLPASKLLSTGDVKFYGTRICSDPEKVRGWPNLHTPPALSAAIVLELNNLAFFLLDNGDEDRIVKELLYCNADKPGCFNYESGFFNYPPALHLAVNQDNKKLVSRILDNGVDADCRDLKGESCLNGPVYRNNYEMILLLLTRGANASHMSRVGKSALHITSEKGHTQTVELLLEKGADVNLVNKDGDSALAIASGKGHIQIVKLLLEKGADVNPVNKIGDSALAKASRKGHKHIVELLLENGADIHLKGALIEASETDQKHIVELFFEKYIITKDALKGAFLSASEEGSRKVVELLLEKGAGVGQKNCCKKALRDASYYGHKEVVGLILRNRTNEIRGRFGGALNGALLEGHDEVVELLLQNCADGQQYELRSALQKYGLRNAFQKFGHDAVRIMALNAVGMSIAGGNRKDALRYASRWGTTEILEELLLDFPLLLNKLGCALYIASVYGRKEIVGLLLEKYANEVQDNLGCALDLALVYGEKEIADLLLTKGAEASTSDLVRNAENAA